MMKRIIALLLALILTVGLLPTVALAAGETANNDVVSGSIGEDGKWTTAAPDQSNKPEGVETVSKTAKPTSNPNEYEVELKVVLKQTSETKTGAAATALVLDCSGSMDWCTECGQDWCRHKTDDTYNVTFDVHNSNSYYVFENGKYVRVSYCDGYHFLSSCDGGAGWYTSDRKRDHKSQNKLTPKISQTDSAATHVQFYTRTEGSFDTSRMTAAKNAAKNFLKTYSGFDASVINDDGTLKQSAENLSIKRYVAVIRFSKNIDNDTDSSYWGDYKPAWYDVSTKDGYGKVLATINNASAGGGTNLDAGLTTASSLMDANLVKNLTSKNVIALTDGAPTYSKRYGDGGSTNKDICDETAQTAATLRGKSKVYTVCFAAESDPLYDGGGTVGNFLKNRIATQPAEGSNEKYAYNAKSAEDLIKVFKDITDTIVSGLNNGTVKDSLPAGITSTDFGNATQFELNDQKQFHKDVKTETVDGKEVTTYTYTKTYTVNINPDEVQATVDGYAPLNEETTLTVTVDGKEEKIPFPIPAGKVTPTKITDKITVTITGATNTETYDGTEKKAEGYTVTISDPRYTTNDFTFRGTDVVKATNASTNQYMMGLKADDFTNDNEKFTNVEFVVIDGSLTINKKALTIEANDNTVDYDGDPHGGNSYEATGLATGDAVESVTISGSQTNPGTYPNLLVPSEAVIKNAKGEDVKDNYIITYTPGTLVINKLTNAITVTITGTQETKEYNGQTQTVTGFDYTVTGADKNDVTVTLKEGATASASGKDVKTDNDGKYMMGLIASNFTVSSDKYSSVTIKEVEDGWIKITPAQVTLTSETASKDYDGAPLTKPDVTVGGSGQDVFKSEVTGITATGTVTDPGPAVDNTITYTPDTNFKESNYNISKSEGKLSINDIAAPTNLPTVNVYCTNTEVEHADSTGNALKNNTYTSVVSKNAENKYICTITLTDKNSYISDYDASTGATHTSDTTKTDFTKIILHYDTDAKAWPTPIVNFALNVKCDTPTVNVTYEWTGLKGVVFDDDQHKAPTLPKGETVTKGSPYTVDFMYPIGSTVTDVHGNVYKFSGWDQKGTIIVQENTTIRGTWTKSTGTFELDGKIFKSFTAPDDVQKDFYVTVTPQQGDTTDTRTGTLNLTGGTTTDVQFNFNNVSRITFTEPGTYTYLVEEAFDRVAHPDGIVDKIHYDTKQYLLTITVDTVNGNLTVDYGFTAYPQTDGEAVPKDTITFRNSYFEDPNADIVTLDLSKYVTKTFESRHGKSATETFEAKVEIWLDDVQITTNAAEEENSIAVYAEPEWPKEYTGIVTLSTGETKSFDFGNSIKLDCKHRYRIRVTETAGSNTDVEYDTTEYETYFNFNLNKEINWYKYGGDFSFTNTYTGIDDYYPIIIPTIINKDTGMLNKTDHFAYVIGYPDGTVHPNGQITRAEVATIFFRLLRDEVRDGAFTTSNSYSDVAYGKWYNNPISTMSALGIITGYPDGTFKPNKPITRAEFAAIAARFDETQSGKSATFSDVIGHWAAKEIGIAYYNDWIKGYPDGTFKPDQNITRAEAMTLINRVLERKPESPADLLTNMNKWTDNMDTSKWYYLDVQEATNSHGYTRKTFNYELWRQMLPDPDWSRYER